MRIEGAKASNKRFFTCKRFFALIIIPVCLVALLWYSSVLPSNHIDAIKRRGDDVLNTVRSHAQSAHENIGAGITGLKRRVMTHAAAYIEASTEPAPASAGSLRTAGRAPARPAWACTDKPFATVVAETAARAKVQRVRVLVTGGAGFVASHVAGFCVNTLGYEVVVADDLSGGFVANVPDRATLVKVGSTTSSAAPALPPPAQTAPCALPARAIGKPPPSPTTNTDPPPRAI